MKGAILLFSLLLSLQALAQEKAVPDSMKLIFMGDIMAHGSQIRAGVDSTSGLHDFYPVFEKVSPIINQADYAIANLEVTLGGKPYSGYPRFSAPEQLAVAARQNGIDVLVTANNHSCDRRKTGILKTIRSLDSLKIKHTGTFADSLARDSTNLLVLSKGNIRVGLLNYTYGTNGIPVPKPTIVNLIDTVQMAKDIIAAQADSLDKLIVVLHWGYEYQSQPSAPQKKLAGFLFGKGVDIIVGAHPHVLQPMHYFPADSTSKERLVAYSLGNFVSNQRPRKRDGGAMLSITLTKHEGETLISNKGYHLVWVNKPIIDGRTTFQVIPAAATEQSKFDGLSPNSRDKIKLFLKDSRALFKKSNKGVKELK